MKFFSRAVTIFFIILSSLNTRIVYPCTAFCLEKDSTIVVGKNLDWPVGDGYIFVNPAGIAKFALVKPEENPVRWVSKYGSVTFNQFGKEFPLGGMNEAGLVVEELSYSPSVYPGNDSLSSINELQWIQYQLDNYRSVREIIRNLDSLQISKFLFGLHYFVCDRSGDAAVIEFIDGKNFHYSGKNLPVRVLSNNSYLNSMKYLKLHRGFGGDRIPTDGPESPERFARAAGLVQNYENIKQGKPEDYAFTVLENVKQHDTQWSIVYDATNLHISFFTAYDSDIHVVKLKSMNFNSRIVTYFNLRENQIYNKNISQNFSELHSDSNRLLIDTILNQMLELNEIDWITSHKLKETFLDYLTIE